MAGDVKVTATIAILGVVCLVPLFFEVKSFLSTALKSAVALRLFILSTVVAEPRGQQIFVYTEWMVV